MRPAAFLSGALLLAALFAPGPAAHALEAWASATGTYALNGMPLGVTVWAKDQASAGQALAAVAAEAERLHQQYSPLRPGSMVSLLNQTTGEKPVTVDLETLSLLQWALKLAGKTSGALDPTTAAFKWQYGFRQQEYHVPTDLRLDQIKTMVSYTFLDLYPKDRIVLFKRQGMQIDLDDILVNYALNRLRQAAKGTEAGRLDLGPNLAVWGRPPDAKTWREPIRDPKDRKQILAVVDLNRGRLLSAGVFEKIFEQDGLAYYPYLDPRTGKPARHSQGGTLLLPEQPKLELPASALMLLPPEQAVALVESIPGAECLIKDAAGKIWLSRGWARTLALAGK